ncbi:phage tail tape measure protein [Sporosarcina sp. FSL K6-3457]|uniref:phage tail tape measure protein n=1 Tax=Sporosarcina sp. FSL K6-3457 TaxID=2978204 RepID=UPI0030F8F383
MSLLGQLTVGIIGNMGGLSDTFNQAQSEVQRFGRSIENVGRDLSNAGGALTKSITVPLAAIGGGSLKAAIDFESAFAGVRKTVDATEEVFAELETGIRDMAKAGPTSATELAGIAEAAGQLGIETKNILSFTSTMSDLGVATNMSADEAATALARFANIMNMSQNDFSKLGATIVDLGNNFATTESEIVDMGLRLAGAGAQIGMSEADIIALSTALTSVGIRAEMGGTAMSRVMSSMQVATSSGFTKVQEVLAGTGMSLRDLQMMASHSGKAFGNMAEDMGMTKVELKAILDAGVDLQGFADVAGMTGEQFKKSFEEDAMGAIASFIDGLANAEENGTSAINMLQEMGIDGVLLRDTLLRVGGANELLAESMQIANSAWEDGTALQNEAAERYKTTEAQLATFKNAIKEVGMTLGGALIPSLLHMLDVVKPVIEMVGEFATKFTELDTGLQGTIIAVAGFAAVLGPVLTAIGFMVTNIGVLISAFGGLAGGAAGAGGLIGALTGPIGLAVLAVAGLGLIFQQLWTKSETFRTTVTTAFEVLKNAVTIAIGHISSFVQEKLAAIKTFWDENGAQFLAAVENVFNGIMAVIEFVMPGVLFIIDMVWTAIKQVIGGALDIIMGLVKVFTGLFTGDFGKMWEGIKQIFFGAIDFIIGWMTLTFVGGLRALFANLLKNSLGIIKSLATGIVNFFKSFATTGRNLANGMVNSVLGFFRNMYNTTVNIFGTLRAFGASIWNALREIVVTVAKGIYSGVKTNFTNMLSSIKNIFGTVKNVISTIWNGVMKFFKGINLKQIGKDIILGLINGIGSMASALWDKAKELGNSIKESFAKVMGIASPATEMIPLGADTGRGVAVGVASTFDENKKVVEELGKVIADASKKNADEIVKIDDENEKKRVAIKDDYSKKRAELARKTAQSSQNALKTSKNKKGQIVTTGEKRVYQIQQDASAKLIKLNEDEQKKLIAANDKAWADMQKKEAQAAKERLAAIKQFVEDKKSTEELSMVAEVEVWKKATQEFKVGTKERVDAQKAYQKSLKVVNDEVVKIQTDHTKKINDINERAKKSAEDLQKEYMKAEDDRAKSLFSFVSLYDQFDIKVERTGDQIFNNLQGQLDGLKRWQSEMEKLSSHPLDVGMLAEIREMGPKALPDLIALNELTSDQLSKYSDMYKEKAALARTLAVNEMSGMRDDMAKNIEGVYSAANAELDAEKDSFIEQIRALTTTADEEFAGLEGIGKNAMSSLLDGLSSMESALKEKAMSIATSVKDAMESALNIDLSSSGLLQNVDAELKKTAQVMGDMANLALPSSDSMVLASGPIPSAANEKGVIQNNTYNYERMLEGAVFHVREEMDIKKVAREFYNLEQQTNRGRGGR